VGIVDDGTVSQLMRMDENCFIGNQHSIKPVIKKAQLLLQHF